MEQELLNVSSSPHIRSKTSTQTIMFDVVIALLFPTAFSIWHFGFRALAVVLTSVVFAVGSEFLFQRLMKREVTVQDGSALVTGMILGLNMPVSIPLWIPAFGAVFAIIIVKQLFGGIGQNFMNPALAARCFLLISFAKQMTNFTLDGVASVTPLAQMKAGESVDLGALFVGTTPGCLGETSVIALLLGAAYLLLRKVISLRIPLTYLITFLIFMVLFGGHGFDLEYLAAQLCAGGLIFGAFYMATDYVTSPITPKGQLLYGILLGCFTGLFRTLGASPEGVSYAILLSNLLVPLIERVTIPAAFGRERERHG